MGGRGAVSGISTGNVKVRGVTVKMRGESTDYFFTTVNGVNYYQRGISGMPEPTPQNMTMTEFKKRASSNGAEIQSISKSKISEMEKKYKKDREETNEFLNTMWYKAGPRPRKGWKGH